MKAKIMTVTWKDWNVTSTFDGEQAIAHPFRVLNGRYAHGELYGRVFKSGDEAHKAMAEHGYSQPYFGRRSVPIELFASLDSERGHVAFDRLYRFTKWLRRIERKRKNIYGFALRDLIQKNDSKLARLAVKVGIFHPAAKAHRRLA